MRRLAVATLAALTLALGACTNRAAEMLETAQFEEQQQNVEHARELYERIARDHPDTPEAKTARERLAALGAASR
jgi:TolA-binding protein